MSRAIDALTQQNRHADRCTGVAAAWCPIHGDCICPSGDDGSHVHYAACDVATGRAVELRAHDPACPLHAPASLHAT